jgi:hypothetical protein
MIAMTDSRPRPSWTVPSSSWNWMMSARITTPASVATGSKKYNQWGLRSRATSSPGLSRFFGNAMTEA